MASLSSRLQEAAMEGSVAMLLELLQQDPLLLHRAYLHDLTETPLHVAALLGHVDFVDEILRRKPQLVKELDSQRASPLHFAAATGHLEVVRSLLQVDADMCFVCNEDGRNPLHLAAMKGQVDVLAELIGARPLAARTAVDHGGTILHLCVKNNQLEALRMLIEAVDDDSFLNAKDDYGFTVLHLAVSNKQIETVQYLVNDSRIKANALNSNGFTALDVLTQSHRDVRDFDIAESLRAAGALKTAANLTSSTSFSKNQEPRSPRFRVSPAISRNRIRVLPSIHNSNIHKKETWLSRKRDGLMVVASLIATMAFQAGINPPDGIWEDGNPSAAKDPVNYPQYILINTISFTASLSVITMLVTGLPFKHRVFLWILVATMWIAVTSIGSTYATSIRFFSPTGFSKVIVYVFVYCPVTICVVIGFLPQIKVFTAKMNNLMLHRERLPTYSLN